MQPRNTEHIHEIDDTVAYRSKDGTVKPAKVVNYNNRSNTYTVRNSADGRVVAVQAAYCYAKSEIEYLHDASTREGMQEANEYFLAFDPEDEKWTYQFGPSILLENSGKTEVREEVRKPNDVRNVITAVSVLAAILFGTLALNASHEAWQSKKAAEEAVRTKTKPEIVAHQVNALNIEKAKFAGSCKQVETIDAEIRRLLGTVDNFR